MTKQDWEKILDSLLEDFGKNYLGFYEYGSTKNELDFAKNGVIDFIRQTREQAKQEGIEEAIEALRLGELMDMSYCRSRLTGSTSYQIPTTEKTSGYNEAVSDLETKISELKKK